jgi:hypothetical protein
LLAPPPAAARGARAAKLAVLAKAAKGGGDRQICSAGRRYLNSRESCGRRLRTPARVLLATPGH